MTPSPGDILNKFFNGDFEITSPQSTDSDGIGHIPGWSIYIPGVSTGVPAHLRMNGFSTILGCPTPNDPSPTYANAPAPYADQGLPSGMTYTWQIVTGTVNNQFGGNNILKLSLDGTSVSFGVVRGPYVVCDNALEIAVGDKVYFHWKAEGGTDDFDVFGYLIEQNPVTPGNCRSIVLLDSSSPMYGSKDTLWERVEHTVKPGENGIYKFVFVCGTYDKTGGRAVGAILYLDNINIIKATPPTTTTTTAASTTTTTTTAASTTTTAASTTTTTILPPIPPPPTYT